MLAPALMAVSMLISGAWLPDPAPYGAQRPYEPDVAGPKNLDRLDVTVTRNDASSGKGMTIAYDRHSRGGSFHAESLRPLEGFTPGSAPSPAACREANGPSPRFTPELAPHPRTQ